MNRFEYDQLILGSDETIVAKHKGIKLYDGDHKVNKRML